MSESTGEYSSEESFRELVKTSDFDVDIDTLVDAANKSFDEVAGATEGALDIWKSTTLPDAVRVYKGNPMKLGRTLLEIIDKTGEQKGVENTLNYLQKAIPKDEVAFSEADKKAHSEKLVSDIESMIAEYAAPYGDEYKGVVAIVIWGSYARFQQRLHSDIDFSSITVDDPLGFAQGDFWVSTDDFEDLMAKKLDDARTFSVDMQSWASAVITDEQSIRNMIELETPDFLVASPFPEIKEKVRRLLEEEIRLAK